MYLELEGYPPERVTRPASMALPGLPKESSPPARARGPPTHRPLGIVWLQDRLGLFRASLSTVGGAMVPVLALGYGRPRLSELLVG